MDDFNLSKPLALESLSTQFEPTENKKGKQNAIERDSKKKKKNKSTLDDFDFAPFDAENSTNF